MQGKLTRDPIFSLIIIGAALFIFYQYFYPQQVDAIQLSPASRNQMVNNFETLTGRKASAVDTANIEREYIEEEILFREAITSGLHLMDSEVRSKLVEEMRYQITGIIDDPSEQQLIDFYFNNIERYFREPNVTFEHVYFEQKPLESEQLLQDLSEGSNIKGDEFWRGNRMPNYGDSMLRGMFGQEFVDLLHGSPKDQWLGPYKSSAGWHFIYVFATQSKIPLSFDHARIQIENDWMVSAIKQAVSKRVQELESKHKVIRHES